MDFKTKQRSSSIWQGKVCSSDLSHVGLCWKVNNGRRGSFWRDKWLQDSSLLRGATRSVEGDELNASDLSYWEDIGGRR